MPGMQVLPPQQSGAAPIQQDPGGRAALPESQPSALRCPGVLPSKKGCGQQLPHSLCCSEMGGAGRGGGCCLPGKQPRLTLRKRGMGPPAGCEGGSVAGGWGSPRRSKGPEGGEQPDRESRAARSSCCPGQRLPLAVSGLHFPCRWAPQCRVVHPCPQRKDPSISGTCPGPSSQ